MILCDSNVWLALAFSGHSFHSSALDWFDSITEPDAVCFCRATQRTLLRLLTSAAVLGPFGNPPLTNRQAWNVYESLLADDRIVLQHREPAGLERRWKEFALRDASSPKLWMDAYLAAFALAGGYQFVTIDKAFAQFEGLDLLLLPSPDP
jgi:toxin-antitoxin system PIN domain toxin